MRLNRPGHEPGQGILIKSSQLLGEEQAVLILEVVFLYRIAYRLNNPVRPPLLVLHGEVNSTRTKAMFCFVRDSKYPSHSSGSQVTQRILIYPCSLLGTYPFRSLHMLCNTPRGAVAFVLLLLHINISQCQCVFNNTEDEGEKDIKTRIAHKWTP